jgi:hypothetical protein
MADRRGCLVGNGKLYLAYPSSVCLFCYISCQILQDATEIAKAHVQQALVPECPDGLRQMSAEV